MIIISEKDTKSRKFQLTINNPVEKGYSHEVIKNKLSNFKSVVYYCMADEIGDEKTPHTHIFIAFSDVVRFSTIKNAFPEAHIEKSLGTSQDNKNYITKTGKWENSEKHETVIEGTFEEWGELPQERQGARTDLEFLYNLIKSGVSTHDIIETMPEHMKDISTIEKVRQMLIQEQGKNQFRQLEVTYIYGKTAVGKTRYVMEKYGYENVFRITDYSHPYDSYQNQDVICYDEFAGNFKIQDMLNFLDGYPLELSCRFFNKWAVFTKVYIISNLDLWEQYRYEQQSQPEVWSAFIRRIHKVIRFMPDGTRREYATDEYLNGFTEVENDTDNPFMQRN